MNTNQRVLRVPQAVVRPSASPIVDSATRNLVRELARGMPRELPRNLSWLTEPEDSMRADPVPAPSRAWAAAKTLLWVFVAVGAGILLAQLR